MLSTAMRWCGLCGLHGSGPTQCIDRSRVADRAPGSGRGTDGEPPGPLPQWILVKHKTAMRVVSRCRIRTSSFRKGELLHSPSMQQPREAKVSFDAARL